MEGLFAITVEILVLSKVLLSSISGQAHEFAENSKSRQFIKKQIDTSFPCVCPVIDNEFRQLSNVPF